MIRIVLADDHPIVRQGLRTLLERNPGYEVVGEADDGLATLALVEQLKPDVLVVDMMMPGLNGLEVTRQVHRRAPSTRIVVLSMHSNESYVLGALRNGASAYVLKATSTASLSQAVQSALRGERYLSPPLSEHAIAAYISQVGDADENADYATLTSREREVFQLAVEGHSNAEIGARLSISERTAETHRGNIMRKLGLRSEADLVRFALEHHIPTGLEGS